MRAMILAAGLGTRMRPLSDLRAKPALPVRGIPVLAYLLELLHHHGVSEVMLNTHHLPQSVEQSAEAFRPAGMKVSFSPEEAPLGTGGGIRRAASFLRESDPCLVLAGDMILDLDLAALVAQHRARGDTATLVLRGDSRVARFGSIGVDEDGAVRRIAESFDLGGETQAGVFVGARVFSSRMFESMPDRDSFEDLRDWIAPVLDTGVRTIRGAYYPTTECVWEPVGTPAEYLKANLAPVSLSFLDRDSLARARGTRFDDDLVLGKNAALADGARLRRSVVWEREQVPSDLDAADGVFAGGKFHSCLPNGAESATE
jgi:mannose-1-phosphate guanylyltransferase